MTIGQQIVTTWLKEHQLTLLSRGGLEALARMIDAALKERGEEKGAPAQPMSPVIPEDSGG